MERMRLGLTKAEVTGGGGWGGDQCELVSKAGDFHQSAQVYCESVSHNDSVQGLPSTSAVSVPGWVLRYSTVHGQG